MSLTADAVKLCKVPGVDGGMVYIVCAMCRKLRSPKKFALIYCGKCINEVSEVKDGKQCSKCKVMRDSAELIAGTCLRCVAGFDLITNYAVVEGVTFTPEELITAKKSGRLSELKQLRLISENIKKNNQVKTWGDVSPGVNSGRVSRSDYGGVFPAMSFK